MSFFLYREQCELSSLRKVHSVQYWSKKQVAVSHWFTVSPDQSHAIPHLPRHNTVNQLQRGSYSQLGTVVDVLGRKMKSHH